MNWCVKEEINLYCLQMRKPHWDLAKKYNLIDFELGNKITGSGFPVYINREPGFKGRLSSISWIIILQPDSPNTSRRWW